MIIGMVRDVVCTVSYKSAHSVNPEGKIMIPKKNDINKVPPPPPPPELTASKLLPN
jgi:hypothetical protein